MSYTNFWPVLTLLLCGCLSDVGRVESRREKSAKSIPEITEIVRDSEYGRENALAYYWIFRIQAENIRESKIPANEAERIGQAMVEAYGLKKGAVDGFAEAVQKQLKPWAGEDDPEDYPEGYCERLMQIAESCRRAAK